MASQNFMAVNEHHCRKTKTSRYLFDVTISLLATKLRVSLLRSTMTVMLLMLGPHNSKITLLSHLANAFHIVIISGWLSGEYFSGLGTLAEEETVSDMVLVTMALIEQILSCSLLFEGSKCTG